MKKTTKQNKNENYFTDVTELYRVALKCFIDMHTKERFKSGVLKKITAAYANISFGNLNGFINKKVRLSEKKRMQLVSFLGFRYEEFIALGRKLAELQKNNMPQDEPGAEAFALNRASAKIIQELQEKRHLSDRAIANCLNMDLLDYTFKQRGLIPFSFDEIATIFEQAGQGDPDADDSIKK